MRAQGLVGIHRRRRYSITRRDPRRPSYPDLVERESTPTAPNRLRVADLTQYPTGEGWPYLELPPIASIVTTWSNVCFFLGIGQLILAGGPTNRTTHHGCRDGPFVKWLRLSREERDR